jgi:2-polyprenyl-3-methyl-5-hydroxy-6-metoxy-1,4-benzoquinol methylase
MADVGIRALKSYNARMAGVGDNYILPGRSDHDRLRIISEIHDGRTRELLLRAGFARGCFFVEFGCGLGYVTRLAADEGAQATGIDVNEEQVQGCQDLARKAGSPTLISASAMSTNLALSQKRLTSRTAVG